MWSSDRSKRVLVAAGLLGALSAFSACTARPLYADPTPGDGVEAAQLANLRGRIAISEAGTRTDQLVRNELLSRLNQGARVREPLYEVRLAVTGVERGLSIDVGGVASSALYDMSVSYTLVRLSDNQTIDTGTRKTITPFDRNRQLFQAQRALLAARRQAAKEVAAQLEIAVSTALQQAGV